MDIQVTNNILNLASLQEKLERTVFEQIDTSQNWQRALQDLTQLHTQINEYFQSVLERNEGVVPKSNPYWFLFLSSASKITYFYHMAKQHVKNEQTEQVKAEIIKGYIVATKLLPDNLSEENKELLAEIQSSIAQLDPTITIPQVKNEVQDCLTTFKNYVNEQLS